VEEMSKLADYFHCLNFTDDLVDVLSTYIKDNGERDLIAILDYWGIKYSPFHYY
jgi:hypothetical protein